MKGKVEEINIKVMLDKNNICQKIFWEASNSPDDGISESKALALSLWDSQGRGTAKIDLWTQDMDVYEMKRFVIETIAGLADTVRLATEDDVMAMELEILAQQMGRRLEKELEANK